MTPNPLRSLRSFFLSFFLPVFILFFLAAFEGVLPATRAIAAEDGDLERALLRADWQSVLDQTGRVADPGAAAPGRAIRGHACLLLNRNNEALRLFLTLPRGPETGAWLAWCTSFVGRHPDHPVALYLLGDALARSGTWPEALGALERALELDPSFAAAANARGVVLGAMGQTDRAEESLRLAVQLAPGFADARASHGTLLILQAAPEGALEDFESALRLTPDFALARNGRGCAQYGLLDWDMANEDFTGAASLMSLPLFHVNLLGLMRAAEETYLPGIETSPLFRISDFLDWHALHQRTLEENDLLRAVRGGAPLPDQMSPQAIDELNGRLGDPGVHALAAKRMDLGKASREAAELIRRSAPCRADSSADSCRVVLAELNRFLLELAYPGLIARHRERDPGAQLTSTGFMSGDDYMASMTPGDVAAGQWRVDHLWRPMADAVSAVGGLGDFLGTQWNRHLDLASDRNLAKAGRYGMTESQLRPSGVQADLRRDYLSRKGWPVTNWFGLGYVLD